MPCMVLFYQFLHVYPSFRPWFLETNTVQSHSFILVHVRTVKQTPCAVFTKKIVLYTMCTSKSTYQMSEGTLCEPRLAAYCKSSLQCICVYQCSQSVWSVRFWASRFRIKNYLYGSGSVFFHQQTTTTIKQKPWFLQFFDFLKTLKTDVIITTVSIKQKDLKRNYFSLSS